MKTTNLINPIRDYPKLSAIALAAALGFMAAGPALAATHTWTQTVGGAQSWEVDGNWSVAPWPSPASGDTVDFSTVTFATNTTLTLGADRTAEVWKFGDAGNAQDWTIAASNKIILAGTTPTIDVVNRTATLLNALDGSAGLTKTGSGTLTLGSTSNTYTGATVVSNGTLKLMPGASGGIVPLANIAATAQNDQWSAISDTVAWIGMDRGTQASPDKNALASNNYANQWTPGANLAWGKWDLDKTATNSSFNIGNVFWWQYSQGGYTDRGMRTAKLYYSNMETDPGDPGDGNSNWTQFYDNTGGTAFPLSGGVNNHHAVVDLSGLNFAARWIGILPTSPTTDISGMGTILFTTADVPGGSLPSSTALSIASGATFDLNGTILGQTIASLSDSGVVTNSSASATTLTINPTSGSTTFSGAIGGPINLVKSGIATQVLTGASTHTGGTAVSEGTLLVNAPGSITGAVSVASGATLGGTGAITGNVTFATGASALFTHGAPLTFTGPVTLNNNTVHLALPENLADGNYLLATGSFSGAFAPAPVIDSGSTVSPNRTIATSASEVRLIVSSGDISPPMPDPMTFAVKPAALNANTVVMTATTATDASTPVQYYFENTTNSNNSGWITDTVWTDTGLTAGTTYAYRVKARDQLGNTTAWSAEADIVTTGWTATNLYWDGGTADIAGNGDGASQGGSGTWDTTIWNWDLGSAYPHVAWDNPNNDTAVFGGTAGTVTLGTVAAGSVTFTNFTGTYTLTGGSLAISSNLTVDSTAGNVTLSTPVSGSGGMVKDGANTLTLNGTHDYTGDTTINAGTISLATAASIGSGPIAVNNGGTLYAPDYDNLNRNFTLNGGALKLYMSTISGTITLSANSIIYAEGSNFATSTIDAPVSGVGRLTQNGPGRAGATLLTGTNTYTGETVINNGALIVKSSLYDNDTSKWTPSNITVASNAVLGLSVGGAGEFTMDQVAAMFTNLTTDVNNNGMLPNSFMSMDTRNASAGTYTFSGVLADSTGTGGGAVNFEFNGTSTTTLELTGANTYSGVTMIRNNGTLRVSSLNSVFTNPALGTVHSASSSLGAPTTVANGTILLGESSWNGNTMPGTSYQSGNLTYTGTGETTDRVLLLGGYSGTKNYTLDQSGTGLLKFTSNIAPPIANTTQSLILAGSTTGTGEIAGVIPTTAGGNTTLTKNGTGTWTLSGVNLYAGTTTVNGGNLVIGGAGQLGSGTYAANIALNGTSSTLTYNSSEPQTLSGVISGTGSLTQAGPGTLTLTGINSNTGATTVSGGILAVNGTSLSDTGKLVISGGVVEPTGIEIVDTLSFGTAPQVAGTWGASGSGADHIDDVRFAGTAGVVSVTNMAITGIVTLEDGTTPVAGVKISAAGGLLTSDTLTLADGTYSVAAKAGDTVNVSASKAKYQVTDPVSNLYTINTDTEPVTGINFKMMVLPTVKLVDLKAAGLPAGVIATWTNTGDSGGVFNTIAGTGTAPEVKDVGGVTAVALTAGYGLASSINTPAAITGTNPWTMAAWVYRAADFPWQGSEECIIGLGNSNPYDLVMLNYSNDPDWGYIDSGVINFGNSNPPARGVWHSIVATYDGATLNYYADKALLGSGTGALRTPELPMTIGFVFQGNGATQEDWSLSWASIASIEIYDNALSKAQIDAIYDAGIGALTSYSTWANTNAPGQTPGQDYDNDGVENGIEYFMGETGSSFTAMPGLDGDNKVSWPASAAYQGTYEVQTSPDLDTWTPADPQPTPSDGSLSYTLPADAPGGKSFVRLLVTPTP